MSMWMYSLSVIRLSRSSCAKTAGVIWRRSSTAELFDRELSRRRLFEWIGQSHAAHHDVSVGQRRIETRVDPHSLQRAASRDCDRHSAE